MISNPVFFYISAFLIIMPAIATLFQKNLIYSLLCSIIVFFAGGIFFYILGSEYNAITQAAIYGLAVPIILGLSIMLTVKTPVKTSDSIINYIILVCGGIFIMAFVYLIMISLAMLPDTFNYTGINPVNNYDIMLSFAKGIFLNHAWAFELLAILLTIVVAGFSLIRKRGL